MVEHRSPKPGVGGSSPFAPAIDFRKVFMKFIEFLKGVKQELFKITWLSKKEALISSGIVVAVSIIFALVFTLFDFVIFNTVQFILSIGK